MLKQASGKNAHSDDSSNVELEEMKEIFSVVIKTGEDCLLTLHYSVQDAVNEFRPVGTQVGKEIPLAEDHVIHYLNRRLPNLFGNFPNCFKKMRMAGQVTHYDERGAVRSTVYVIQVANRFEIEDFIVRKKSVEFHWFDQRQLVRALKNNAPLPVGNSEHYISGVARKILLQTVCK